MSPDTACMQAPLIAFPRPVRTFADAATGVTIHQLTDGMEQSGPMYFTRSSWTADGRHLLIVREIERSANYFACGLAGQWRQISFLPAPHENPAYVRHMNRCFRTEEGDRIMLRLPAMHPTLLLLAYAWQNEIHLLTIGDDGDAADEVIYRFSPSESEMPHTPLHAAFTADGRDLILTTVRAAKPGERLDPPAQRWVTDLRDESGYIGKIWRYMFHARCMKGKIFASNGEQSHLLTCPWDPGLILWVNYGHRCLYSMQRDGTGLRRYLDFDDPIQPNHYSWDVANRRLICNLSDVANAWRTRIISLDLASGEHRTFASARLPHPAHITASPDGRWIAIDVNEQSVDGTQGLHLLDQEKDEVYPLCRCTWSALKDSQGNPVKSEYLHPNANFSPDGRYLVFGTDYGSLVAQVYAADLHTWRGGKGLA